MTSGFKPRYPPVPSLQPRSPVIPILTLTLSLLELTCVSPPVSEEPIATRQSALGATPIMGRATSVSTGFASSCARLSTGAVVCWGDGRYGQLGNGSTVDSPVPVAVYGLYDASSITTSNWHVCALRQTGTVVCWGNGFFGQLGNGTTADSSVPVAVSGISDAVAVAAGFAYTCALRGTGQVMCWGRGVDGELGNGGTNNSNAPVAVTGLSDAISIAAGESHACAIRATGGVVCWGDNFWGQLGNGANVASSVPVAVTGLSDAISVAPGGSRTCAVRATGEVACWGYGGDGRLGNGGSASSPVPVAVTGLSGAVTVTVGGDAACALRGTGDVVCWGQGAHGELGNGSSAPSAVPVAVTGLSGVVSVAAGVQHACAVRGTGEVVCWGNDDSGQLGNATSASSNVPVVASGISDGVSVTAGLYSTCAVRGAGAIACWGYGFYGQLGNGTSANSPVPIGVTDVSDAVSVAAGVQHVCAVRRTGEVICWGDGTQGQLGDGNSTSSSLPVAVTGVSDAVSVAAGYRHSCAVRSTGAVLCWGDNRVNQLGDGTATGSPVPVAVSGLADAVSVSAGASHACAVRRTGAVVCWGYGGNGQLGNGSTDNAAVPVAVAGLSDAQSVAAGSDFTCAVRGNGRVVCWGNGGNGQLGNGSADSSALPVTVAGLSDAVSISAGFSHACAVRATGAAVCWGRGLEGQLGNGSASSVLTPYAWVGSDGFVGPNAPLARASTSDGNLTTFNTGPGAAVAIDSNGSVWLSDAWANQLHKVNPVTGAVTTYPVPIQPAGIAADPVGNLYVAAFASTGGIIKVRASDGIIVWTTTEGCGNASHWGTAVDASGNVWISCQEVNKLMKIRGADGAILGTYDVGADPTGVAVDRSGNVWVTNQALFPNAGSPSVMKVDGITGAVIGTYSIGNSYPTAVAVDGVGNVWVTSDAAPYQSGSAQIIKLSGADGSVLGVHDVASSYATALMDGVALDAAGHVWAVVHDATVAKTDTLVELNGADMNLIGTFDTGVHTYGWIGDFTGFALQTFLLKKPSSTVPVAVEGLSAVVSVAAGADHTCAVRAGGQVLCWGGGLSSSGQLGNGTPPMSSAPVAVLGLGDLACSTGAACASGFCVDGVCCNDPCGGGDPNDCQACSVAAGAANDGICGVRATGAACGATPGICQMAGTCGGATTCPGPAPIAECAPATVPGCSGSCDPISLRGGLAVEDGLSVEFQGGVSAGQISVTPCNAISPPPTGYKVMDGMSGKYCWDLHVGATVSYTTPPPIIVCIHYPEAIAANENVFQMAHDDGSGVFAMNTTDRFPEDNTICGFANSLSPFAIVVPLDRAPPVFSNVPGPITTYATSTAGAKVTYTLPKAVDAIDGQRPVTCSRASGTTFPPGKTTVTCTASDKVGNTGTATFTVWVQYQAPADGTFFLKPIRPDGSSIFPIGRAVPVKFKLTGASAGITNLTAKLVVTKISGTIRGTANDVSDEDGEDTDFLFKFRPGQNIYGYRWKTRGETQGTYQLRADLGDQVVHQVNVSLKATK